MDFMTQESYDVGSILSFISQFVRWNAEIWLCKAIYKECVAAEVEPGSAFMLTADKK